MRRRARAPGRAVSCGCCVWISIMGRFCAKALSCGFEEEGVAPVAPRTGTEAPHSRLLENRTPGYFMAGFLHIKGLTLPPSACATVLPLL